MKIIGFTYLDDRAEMMLRCDSCLLNGGKPFFLPDDASDLRATRCVVLRVSRLGKNIAAKFANRYFDAWADGLDIIDHGRLDEARRNGHSWTEAVAHDYSLPVGDWQPISSEQPFPNTDFQLCIPIEQAVEQVSRLMTIRQGDLIYIDAINATQTLTKELVITGPNGRVEQLYCKIK